MAGDSGPDLGRFDGPALAPKKKAGRNRPAFLCNTSSYGVAFTGGFFAKSPARTMMIFFGSMYFRSAALI